MGNSSDRAVAGYPHTALGAHAQHNTHVALHITTHTYSVVSHGIVLCTCCCVVVLLHHQLTPRHDVGILEQIPGPPLRPRASDRAEDRIPRWL